MRPSTRMVVLGRNLFTPSSVNTSLWLKDDISSLTLDNSKVINWFDNSGNARHFRQNTATNQPSFNNSTIDWGNALNTRHLISDSSFSISDVIMLLTYGSGAEAISQNNYYGILTTTESTHILGNREGNVLVNSTFFKTATINGGATFDPTISAVLPLNKTILYIKTKTSKTATGTWVLGGDRTFTEVYNRAWLGSISEVIATDTPWTSEEVDKLIGYLAWERNLTSNLSDTHPYKYSAPKD
jgi:hypothetical protein